MKYIKRKPVKAHTLDVEDLDVWENRFEYVHIPTSTVDDHVATFTGLLDKDGDEIWRAPNPIGFIWGD